MEERKGDSSVAFFVGEGGRGACCTKLFCPLFRAADIRFSKCSGYSVEGRTQPDYIRHRGSSNPCLDIVSKHCWELYRTLRKSNILRKSQMPK